MSRSTRVREAWEDYVATTAGLSQVQDSQVTTLEEEEMGRHETGPSARRHLETPKGKTIFGYEAGYLLPAGYSAEKRGVTQDIGSSILFLIRVYTLSHHTVPCLLARQR